MGSSAQCISLAVRMVPPLHGKNVLLMCKVVLGCGVALGLGVVLLMICLHLGVKVTSKAHKISFIQSSLLWQIVPVLRQIYM